MNVAEYPTQNISVTSWVWVQPQDASPVGNSLTPPHQKKFDIFKPMRQWIDQVQVNNRNFAHSVCKLIPAQCPFERDVKLFGKVLFHIPPMCKLNPLYEEVVGLRFRALCYLADECGEDISAYC